MNIAIAGTGYVGMSMAVLLSQHNHITAVDIIQEKVDPPHGFPDGIIFETDTQYFELSHFEFSMA